MVALFYSDLFLLWFIAPSFQFCKSMCVHTCVLLSWALKKSSTRKEPFFEKPVLVHLLSLLPVPLLFPFQRTTLAYRVRLLNKGIEWIFLAKSWWMRLSLLSSYNDVFAHALWWLPKLAAFAVLGILALGRWVKLQGKEIPLGCSWVGLTALRMEGWLHLCFWQREIQPWKAFGLASSDLLISTLR